MHLYQNFSIDGEVEVHTRAKFYEAHVLVDAGAVTLPGVSDDASRHGAGNLAGCNSPAIVADDADCGALVLGAALGEICRIEAPVMMLHIIYNT